MCGIAGFWLFKDSSLDSPEKTLSGMTERLSHRGPDDSGLMMINTASGRSADLSRSHESGSARGDLFMGHRRLSIIDLSRAGHQPMQNASGDAWIVYNGEIYNYIELRDELMRLGHRFSTNTDTEVILSAYQQWGVACLNRFNGMFAFALWDQSKGRLFCSRDRFGVKPFYYYHDERMFAFASEIKALLLHPQVPMSPNDSAVYDYLIPGLVDHSEETFFKRIRQISPAHYLLLEGTGALSHSRWWDVVPNPDFTADSDRVDALHRDFHALLQDSVSLRLRSDVPVGTCLSGGLDSSSIVCLVNQFIRSQGCSATAVGEKQKTFSACFADLRFDERKFITPVIEHTGATNFQVFPGPQQFGDEMFDFVRQMDEPVLSTSPYSQWNVMRKVKESGVKVILDGQGSDELMAGYPAYYPIFIATLLKKGLLAEAWQAAWSFNKIGGRGKSIKELALKTGYGLLSAKLTTVFSGLHALWGRSPIVASQTLALLDPAFRKQHRSRLNKWINVRNDHFKHLSKRLYDDVFRFCLPSLLRYEDRNSMAFSVEARVPFLDYRLVELIFSMPMCMKINLGWSKWPLRLAMQNILPEVIRCRKDKMGFVSPEADFLRENYARIIPLYRNGCRSVQYLKGNGVGKIIDDTLNPASRSRYLNDIWRWVNLECWMRIFF
jgi:asparagine synthase (glutamine-hydrolysing)